jgi:hypothetical protein
MDALEHEIIAKFHRLEADAKQRVLDTLSADVTTSFDYEAWWAQVEALQASIRSRLSDTKTVDILSLLDELRDESS